MGREFQGGEFVVRWDDDFRLDLESDWIQALPDALREVHEALQAYPDGATAGDIASAVGISVTTAHDRLHRLAGKGLVERRTRTSGRGRPEVVWRALPARGKEEKR
jgi:predicted ArsR family transcriptional regulator